MIGLVRGNRAFARLLSSRLISELGSFFTYMLLIVLSYGATRSVALTMGVTLAAAVGRLAGGSYAGLAADRGAPRRIMVQSDLFNAAVLCVLIVLPPTVWFKYGASFLIAVGQSFYTPAMNKFQVAAVDEEGLMDANALLQTTNEVVKIVGPALAVFVLTLVPVPERGIGFLVDAASYVLSALLIFRLRVSVDASEQVAATDGDDSAPRGFLAQWAAGAAPLRNTAVAMVAVEFVFLLLGVSGADVLFTAYVAKSGYPTIDVGYLMAALSGGLILSALTLKGIFSKWSVSVQLGLTGVAMGVFYGGVAVWPLIGVMLAASFLLGIFNGIFNVSSITFWQRVVPREVLGRFFAMVTSVFAAVSLIGMAATGYLGSVIGPRDTLLLGGALIALSGIVGTVLMSASTVVPATAAAEEDTIA